MFGWVTNLHRAARQVNCDVDAIAVVSVQADEERVSFVQLDLDGGREGRENRRMRMRIRATLPTLRELVRRAEEALAAPPPTMPAAGRARAALDAFRRRSKRRKPDPEMCARCFQGRDSCASAKARCCPGCTHGGAS